MSTFLMAEMAEQNEQLRQRIEALKAALLPFVEFPAANDPRLPGDMPMTRGSNLAAKQITVADFRSARATFFGGEP